MSAPSKRFDLVAARKYTTRSGEEKTHWINCGEGVGWDDGSITINQRTVPVGGWFDGTLRLFERKERDSEPRQPSRAPVKGCPQPDQGGFEDDDIPF
jgi:hypothetical protein